MGVDISGHQSITDWPQLNPKQISFAFIKATEGVTFVDPKFSSDWTGAEVANIYRSAYHFFIASDDPIQQAQFFLMTMGPMKPNDLPAMLDLETGFGVSANIIVKRAKTWLKIVEGATGKPPIIYTSARFWLSLGHPKGFDHYPLFVVDVENNCPMTPYPWRHWTFWQHSTGTTPGVMGLVDHDVFNGSVQNLASFANPVVAPK